MRRTQPAEEADGAGLARTVHRARLEWWDTDGAGHNHNTSIVRFVEAAEATLMMERGITSYFGAAPRVRYEVDFASPLWFGQDVMTSLVLERIGTSSLTFRFEVWGEAFNDFPRQLAAAGRYVTVHVPPGGSRESAPWPREWVEALQGEPADQAAQTTKE